MVADRTIQGDYTQAIALTLSATDGNGDALTLRVVDQPAEGTVAFDGHNATYFPLPAFSGSITFTYAASDGKAESNLGHVTITVDRVFANGFE